MNRGKSKKSEADIVVYQAKNGALELRGDFSRENIWATQAQIANIFGSDRTVITKHINNILKDKEVDGKSNVQKMHIANSDKPVAFYSLDVILAVGYRTNSKAAIEFRKWATKILRQYIVEGYTINKKRAAENYGKFQKAVEDVQKLIPASTTVSTSDILELIKTFAGAWFSIESYDEEKFPTTGSTKKSVRVQVADLYEAVNIFKTELIKKGEASDLFAQEKQHDALGGILGNVMQSAFSKEFYKTVEEKAAHLLYFIIKNHPFNDGNKRTGAFSFVWFLRKSGIPFRSFSK